MHTNEQASKNIKQSKTLHQYGKKFRLITFLCLYTGQNQTFRVMQKN